jgi:hypothetical protein
MTKFYTLVFIAIAVISCKTASKAYDKGDYRDAVELSIKKLQKDPNDGETKALLQSAYLAATRASESRIRTLSNSSNRGYESIYNEYRRLQSLYETVQPYPSLVTLVHATDYSDYVKTYGQKVADGYYGQGMEAMERGDKASYRTAYRAFRSATRFADSREIRLKMDEAYQAALIHIVVLPMANNYGGFQHSASYVLRNFGDELLRNLRYSVNNEFIQLHTEWDARSKNIIPDQLLKLDLGRFDFGRPYDKNETRTVSKEVVVKETVYKPDSVVKQYAKVTAQITTTKRTMISGGEVYASFLDPQGRVIWNDRMIGEHRWQTSFTTYRGDDRALSESDNAALNKTLDNAPAEEEVMERILDEIRSDMRHRLGSYFSQFD